MKYSLYGFMTIASLIDNTHNQDSPLGELSDDVRTYALDKGSYTKNEYPDVRLISFRSRADETDIEVPLNVRDLCIELGDWFFKRAMDGTLTTNANTTRQAVYAEFNDRIEIVKIGKMTSTKGVFLPQFIEFKLKDKTTYSESILKIWFSDPALKQQYPFYDIMVIPLVDNIDDFFQDNVTVRRIKSNIDLAKLHDKTNIIRGKSPFTLIKTFNYDWNDQQSDDKVPIPWTVIIYGPIGNNIDKIREELARWILANSQQPRDAWEKIFPDIFIPTEYVIAPIWTIPSVPGYRLISAMYSPTMKVSEITKFAKEAMGYSVSHLGKHLEISASLYKSLSFLACGHPQNRLAPVSFYEHMPMYSLIRSRSDDFNRLDAKHQDFIELLNELFIYAENLDDDSELPLDLARVERNGVIYVSKTADNVQYLVTARMNYLSGKLKGYIPKKKVTEETEG